MTNSILNYYNVVNPMINHPQNHHKCVVLIKKHPEVVGLLLGFPHEPMSNPYSAGLITMLIPSPSGKLTEQWKKTPFTMRCIKYRNW